MLNGKKNIQTLSSYIIVLKKKISLHRISGSPPKKATMYLLRKSVHPEKKYHKTKKSNALGCIVLNRSMIHLSIVQDLLKYEWDI